MSRLGEKLLIQLNELMPDQHQALLAAKQNASSYNAFFAERALSSFMPFGPLDFTGLDVMDVGCGLGANLLHIHHLNAASIIGLDISSDQLKHTQALFQKQHPEIAAHVKFCAADAAQMPFPANSFDVLVAADTFEHITFLEKALRECVRVLRPNGRLYVYFPPFYAPWGAHMVNWIRVPWCQVFFSEKTVLKTARYLEKTGQATNNHLPPETRLDLGTNDKIPFVNHITIHRFLKIIQSIPDWHIQKMDFLPPNWRTNKRLPKIIKPVNQLPLVREMFTAKAVFILQKNSYHK